MHEPLFLTIDELKTLTGRSRAPAQIDALKVMRVTYLVNAVGKPVVTRAAVLRRPEPPVAEVWVPRALRVNQ